MKEGPALLEPGVYSVSRILLEVSHTLAVRWRDIRVAGQISDLRPYPSGHVYFSLKDETGRLSAVLWRSDAQRLKFALEEGMEIVATGTLGIYSARGQFQMQISAVEPVGIGALQLAFEQLKRKLAAEGLFDSARKRPLPFLPKRIGIVTSSSGAAIRDILRVLAVRHPDLAVTIYPARVQGEGAAREIAEGIRALNRDGRFDVIVIARGGGSAEDLAAFNDEGLARALAASRIPTVSAIGHETDWSIADLVADVRAPTPSAAAEMIIVREADLLDRIAGLRRRLLSSSRARLSEWRARSHLAARVVSVAALSDLLSRRRDRLTAAREGLTDAVARRPVLFEGRLTVAVGGLRTWPRSARVRLAHERLASRRALLEDRMGRVRERAVARLGGSAAMLTALNPLAILQRGFSVVRREADRRLVTDAANVDPGDAIEIRLKRGRLSARVDRRVEEE